MFILSTEYVASSRVLIIRYVTNTGTISRGLVAKVRLTSAQELWMLVPAGFPLSSIYPMQIW